MLLWIVTCDLYLFHFTVLLNPDFNYSETFLSFLADKVTTGTQSFVSVIWNSYLVGATIAGESLFFSTSLTVISAKAQFLDQDKINSFSHLINGIFKVLQKLLKCFNGTAISVSFLPLWLHHSRFHHGQDYKYFL